jgi:hypothetical protein
MARLILSGRGQNPLRRKPLDFVKTLLYMMRLFHYVVGITAPDKKQEKLVLVVWMAVIIGLIAIALLTSLVVIPQLFNH